MRGVGQPRSRRPLDPRGRLAGAPHALTVAGGTVFAAATRGLAASTDGGRTFTRLVGYRTDPGRTGALR